MGVLFFFLSRLYYLHQFVLLLPPLNWMKWCYFHAFQHLIEAVVMYLCLTRCYHFPAIIWNNNKMTVSSLGLLGSNAAGVTPNAIHTVDCVERVCRNSLRNLALFLCIVTMNWCWFISRLMHARQIVFGNGSSGVICGNKATVFRAHWYLYLIHSNENND